MHLGMLSVLMQTWKISCFRQDEITSENLKPEVLEDILAEGLLIPKFDNATVVKKTWASNVAEAVYSVFRAIATPWNVPWTGETILQVMLLWIAAFWFMGSWMIPFLAHMAGFNKDSLTQRGQALYSLLTDATEGVADIAILCCCLAHFHPLSPGWFKFSIKGNWQFGTSTLLLDASCSPWSTGSPNSTLTYCPSSHLHPSSSRV